MEWRGEKQTYRCSKKVSLEKIIYFAFFVVLLVMLWKMNQIKLWQICEMALTLKLMTCKFKAIFIIAYCFSKEDKLLWAKVIYF